MLCFLKIENKVRKSGYSLLSSPIGAFRMRCHLSVSLRVGCCVVNAIATWSPGVVIRSLGPIASIPLPRTMLQTEALAKNYYT